MSNDFKSILNRLLDNVDDTLDKRQGSIIYDALAPAALELAQCYAVMDIYVEQTYLKTANGINLDNRVADYGITREDATKAIRLVNVYNTDTELFDIDLESRFSIPEEYGGYNYKLIEQIGKGKYKAECETAGTVGNEYLGVLLPLYNINGLGKAEIVGTFKAGEDIEDDEHLRKRALNSLNSNAFGGNQSDYRRYINEIDGVGGAKIFPIWNGGGTVKVSFINSDYTIPDEEFVTEVQNLIDPIANQAEGLGMAPIGHQVTVVAPTKVEITITATLQLYNNYELGSVEAEVKEAIQKYIKEVQVNWENANNLILYISRIIGNILTVEGIDNVTQVQINGRSNDYRFTENATTQEFPILKEVVLVEG